MGQVDEQREAETKYEKARDEAAREFAQKNPATIILRKAWDGNWVGYANKFGELVVMRDVGPQTIVQEIITKG